MSKWIDRLIVAVIVFVACSTWSYAMDREQLYRQFGPKLTEAVVRVMIDEINILRTQHGLNERTKTQAIYSVQSELDALQNYDWMSEGP